MPLPLLAPGRDATPRPDEAGELATPRLAPAMPVRLDATDMGAPDPARTVVDLGMLEDKGMPWCCGEARMPEVTPWEGDSEDGAGEGRGGDSHTACADISNGIN
jgi:hypothetical protein